jgi:hypothetical protein
MRGDTIITPNGDRALGAPSALRNGTTMSFEIIPDSGEIDTAAGRCEAMTLPSYAGDLPAFRCCRVASAERKSRHVCAAHSRTLAIRYWNDDAPRLRTPSHRTKL